METYQSQFTGQEIDERLELAETSVQSETIRNIVQLTQAQYDALGTPASDTMYLIMG